MSVTDEITAIEKRFWQTIVDKDANAGADMLTEASLVTGAQGAARIDREHYMRLMEMGDWNLRSFKLSDIEVVEVGSNVAVIGYKIREDLVVDGKKLVLEAADASTWIKGADGWKCALHTESVLGDPYGRDRKAA